MLASRHQLMGVQSLPLIMITALAKALIHSKAKLSTAQSQQTSISATGAKPASLNLNRNALRLTRPSTLQSVSATANSRFQRRTHFTRLTQQKTGLSTLRLARTAVTRLAVARRPRRS
jgi:hypothetical protein